MKNSNKRDLIYRLREYRQLQKSRFMMSEKERRAQTSLGIDDAIMLSWTRPENKHG